MNGRPGRFGPPRPWHVALAPAVPILALAGGNFAGLAVGSALWSLSVAVVAASLAWAVLTRISRKPRPAALVVSILALVFLSQTTVAHIARVIHFPPLVLLVIVLTIVLCVLILRFGGTAERSTTFANALMVASALLVAWPTVFMQYSIWRSPTRLMEPPPVQHNAPGSRPDVYMLILDGYGRADVLRDYYRYANPLASELESLGFYVAAQAASNYAQTAQSLASSLNYEYLPPMLDKQEAGSNVPVRQRFADLIAENRSFAAFEGAGYRIRSYASEYGLVRPADVDQELHPWLYLTDFEYGLHEGSLVPLFSVMAGFEPGSAAGALHRRHVTWTLDHLEHELPDAGDPPTLVFAHLLVPHPPFFFEPDGSARPSRMPANLYDGSHWRMAARNTGETYQDGYVKAVRFVNARLLQIMRRVLTRPDGRQAIVYIQADHGPGSRLDWDDPGRTDFRERLGILLAVHLPKGTEPTTPLYPSITPVNAVRILLNAAVGTSLPRVEDRSFFSPWPQPLHFIDVTESVR